MWTLLYQGMGLSVLALGKLVTLSPRDIWQYLGTFFKGLFIYVGEGGEVSKWGRGERQNPRAQCGPQTREP